jgi:hypothetical protein
MSDEEKRALIERYEMDSSIAYDVTDDELDVLLNSLGEMEPIVDAINVRAGASIEQRAADIGCDPEDFLMCSYP